MNTTPCPQCFELATFSKKRNQFYCSECEFAFDPPAPQIESQTIFLSYAHKSERADDYDVSEELVHLIKGELEKDGHKVWIDYEGITAGTQWRERITTAILSHTHFLSFLSRRSVRDPGVCLNEIAIALGSGRQIQTLLTESEEAVRLPLTISHLQWHEFADWKAVKDGKKTGPKGEAWDAWFGERIALIRNNLFDVQRIKVMGDLQRLKDILEPRTFEADIISKIEGFYGRKWLFDACAQWINTSTNRLFWLKGSPGIGKSCFAAKLVHQSNSAIVGFFKCEFQGSKSPEESASECIRTLSYQIAARLPDYRMKLLYQQQLDKDKIQKKTADDLFTHLITEPLNASGKIPEATRLALVIDALDEAGRNDGTNALADLIYKHADKLPSWLGVILTSRPEPYLEQQLGKFESTLIEGGTEQNLQDLRDYLNEQLDSSIEGVKRKAIIDKVIDKSGGTFLYLKLIEKDKTLDLAKPETLPEGIDDVFMRDFRRYFPNPKEYGQETEPFLRLMAAAPGPLPVDLAKDLLAWNSRDITTKVTQPLGSLLQEKNGGLVFFHKSLSDWLQDPKRSGLYQVNSTGSQELGNFLWEEFEKGNQSHWKSQVLDWLTALLPSTEYWNELTSLDSLAYFLEQRLKLQASLDLRERGIQLLERLDLQNSLKYFEWVNSTGDVCSLLAQYEKAEFFYRASLEGRRGLSGNSSLSNVDTLRRLGSIKNQLGFFHEAESLYREALLISIEANSGSNEKRAQIMGELAGILNMKADYTGAEKLLIETLQIQENILGKSDIDLARTRNSLAILLRDRGRYKEAHKLYLLAQETFEHLYGENHPDTARGLNNLAGLMSDMGYHNEALPLFQKSLSIREKILGFEHPIVSQSLHNLANLYSILGQYSNADLAYKRALLIRERTLGRGHLRTATTQYRYANLLENLGRKKEAHDLYQLSEGARKELFGLKHPMYSYDLE